MTTDSALLSPATLTGKAPDVYDVKFTTTKGDFVVQVTRAWAPLTSFSTVSSPMRRFSALFRDSSCSSD